MTVVQNGERVEDGTGYTCNATVTVTFTDDEGNVTTESKPVTLRANKRAVTISSVEPVYTVDGKYIPYGTKFANVALSGTAIDSDGDLVAGDFEWVNPDEIPSSVNNGNAVYKVVFKPNGTWASYYSTAETTIAADTQIGVKLKMKVRFDEYRGTVFPVSCFKFYADNKDTGATVSQIVTIEGAELEQDNIEPGTATVKLKNFQSLTISGISGNNLYAIDSTDVGVTF